MTLYEKITELKELVRAFPTSKAHYKAQKLIKAMEGSETRLAKALQCECDECAPLINEFNSLINSILTQYREEKKLTNNE